MPRAGRTHVVGWLLLTVLCFCQSPRLTVADTKHDLTANPAGFLHGALTAWTDIFPMGQLQNQAYGYLFPQGLFFLLADPLPDWIAQRLWWTIVTGVGFSGFVNLCQKLQLGTPVAQFAGALLFALSPHTMSTLGAISSETWPMMLAPWAVSPLLSRRLGVWELAASISAVACMGAVNATATAAACLPAFVVLIGRRAWRMTGGWLVGVLAVSAWWLGPLLVLGRYAPPFTDFIESSFVTTRWLGLVEILRGTTSWAPFADSERTAGTLLATNSYFVLLTCFVAAVGLAGIVSAPGRRIWLSMLLLGVAILGSAHGPFSAHVLALLDGPLAPLRNVHKFDLLVRLPLMVGFVRAFSLVSWWKPARIQQRTVLLSLLIVLAFGALSPAWTGRLAPKGGFEQVPSYWQEAADWLNANAEGTRTMILPATSFARQTWGWTRDEPLQPLLDVPWVVRDAVPLVPPETIRGLDGLLAHPSLAGFESLGVGVVVVRHDLSPDLGSEELAQELKSAGLQEHDFGEVSIFELDLHRSMSVTPDPPVSVAGGGESLALLNDLNGPHAWQLDSENARIVTDTPAMSVRNYGTLQDAESAQLADLSEGSDVHNHVPNYPSIGQPVGVSQRGGEVRVSSSASDATNFGGADPARSATAAVDGSADTAWYPARGAQSGQWLELRPDGGVSDPSVTFTVVGAPVVVTLSAGETEVNRTAYPHQRQTVSLPTGHVDSVRLTLGASKDPAGLASVSIEGHPIERIVSVPASANVEQFVFQRETLDTGLIRRAFMVPRAMTFTVDAATCHEDALSSRPAPTDLLIDDHSLPCDSSIDLSPGEHILSTTSSWITLTSPHFALPPSPISVGTSVPLMESPQLLITHRAFNPGLRATVGGVPVSSTSADASIQAFSVPAGISGPVSLYFVGDRTYRWSLLIGGLVALGTVFLCLVVLLRRRSATGLAALSERVPAVLGCAVAVLVAGWWGLLGVAIAWLSLRFTLIPRWLLSALALVIAGMWLAHGPWPSASYAGDQWFTELACAVALTALWIPRKSL